MTRSKFGLIVTFIFAAAGAPGCSGPTASEGNSSSNASNQQAANSQKAGNDSAEELQSLIPLPFEPEEVTWRASEANGQKKLVAILVLTPDVHRQLAAKHSPPASDVQVSVDQWFPVELITMGEASGEMTVAGKAYAATEFYQVPYTAGTVVFIPDTNYVVLDLHSG